jgi:hypothetical protein
VEAENAANTEIQKNASESESLSLADRLERAVEKELAALERRRVTSPDDPDRTARTLDRLTATLSRIRQLRASGAPESQRDPYDDFPEDINEFRNELARRIEAFVASEAGEEDFESEDTDQTPEEPPGDAPRHGI